ncbi:protein kinase family protein [Desulfobacula phenolica]|uniref:hypothetical protein n=1 Tax=Desulfobacula phenolica TaxID=90732 RepID=UPI003898E75F
MGFAGHSGIKNIPRLLAMDRRNLLGLFQFIEGRKPTEEDIELDYIKQALGFIRKLNYGNKGSALHSLPYASDACFSIAEHIASLERRFKSLQDIVQTDSVCLEAKQFISEVLYPEWKGLKPVIKKKIVGSGIKLEQRLCLEETIISPSDFGFHNSILTKKKLFFIDFEYAGWDDPAKMICDFFCQPEIPVPLDYFTCFVNDVSSMIYGRNKKNTLTRRSKLLFPLYRLKWCCIMLNDFVPAAGKRKKFAFFGEDRRQIQLIKAICYLKASNLKDWF